MSTKEKPDVTITETSGQITPPATAAAQADQSSVKDDKDASDVESSKPAGTLARVPWLGILTAIGAMLTVLASWILLFCISGQSVWAESLKITPNAILTLIYSANAILLHTALSEGMCVAWWYRASKSKTTVKDLHRSWRHGTSTLAAATSGKRFSYIALATVLVAILPLNGFVLQSSLTVEVKTKTMPTNFAIPFSTRASLKKHGWTYETKKATPGLIDDTMARFAAQYFVQYPAFNAIHATYGDVGWINCGETCHGFVDGFGLHSTCRTERRPYDFTVQRYNDDSIAGNQSIITSGTEIFHLTAKMKERSSDKQTGLSSNTIVVEILSKPDKGCSGSYKVETCELQAVEMVWPQYIIGNWTSEFGNYKNSTVMYPDLDWFDFKTGNLYHDYPYWTNKIDDEKWESEWSGLDLGQIASILNKAFGSYVTAQAIEPKMNTSEVTWQFHSTGTSSLLYEVNPAIDADGCSAVTSPTLGGSLPLNVGVSITMNTFLWFVQTNRASYFSEHWNPATDMTESVTTARYGVRWALWGASLVVTVVISLAVLATFWGFWKLVRRTTMSPLETARAFRAPVISDIEARVDTDELIKRVGQTITYERHKPSIVSVTQTKSNPV